jgi:hypothetical protein
MFDIVFDFFFFKKKKKTLDILAVLNIHERPINPHLCLAFSLWSPSSPQNPRVRESGGLGDGIRLYLVLCSSRSNILALTHWFDDYRYIV